MIKKALLIILVSQLLNAQAVLDQGVNQEDIESDLCFLREQVIQQIKYIKQKNMIDVLKRGGEEFYAPAFFYLQLKPLHYTNPKQFNKETWMMAIAALAFKFAEREMDYIEVNYKKEWNDYIYQVADTLNNKLNKYEDLLELSGYVLISRNLLPELRPLIDPIASLTRDFLVNIKTYKTRNANIRWGVERFFKAIEGILLSLSGIEGLSKQSNIKKLARLFFEGSLASMYLEEIVNSIKQSGLISRSSSLREAIENYKNSIFLYEGVMNVHISINNGLVPAASFLAGAKIGAAVGSILPGLGTIVGAIAGAVIGVVLSSSEEFTLYFDVSTALLTFSVWLQEKGLNNASAIYLSNIAYLTAVDIINDHVIDKVITSLPSNIIGGNEQKWKKYISGSFALYKSAVKDILNDMEKVMLQEVDFSMKINCPKDANYYIFVIDVSGSMKDNGKLEQVKKVIPQLVSNFPAKKNYYALVVYSGRFGCDRGRVIIPFTTNVNKFFKAANSLTADGSTPMEAGLLTAFEMANLIPQGKKGQVYLLCDGQQNCPGGERSPALKNIIIRNYGIYGKLKMTANTLAALSQNKNLPQEVVTRLSGLKGKVFNSVAEYDSTLQATLGEDLYKRFKKEIDLYMGATGLPVRVSTISLGKGVDEATLQRLATQGGGYFFKADDPKQLKKEMRKMMLNSMPSADKVKSVLPYLSILLIFLFI